MPSAVAALCSNEQGAFAEYHKALFELQSTPLYNTEEGFLQVATALDLNMDAFISCLDNNSYADLILENVAMVQQAGVNSTPTFFIDGEPLVGNRDLAEFRQRLDALLDS